MPSSEVMKKFSAGKLRSGGKGKGHPKVTNPKQAVAIMYSERRDEDLGLGHPGKKESKKKSFAKAINRRN